jgi:chromate transporter
VRGPSGESGSPKDVSFDRLLKYFLYLGCFGFGGPIATVGYMQRDLVERRGWLDRADFLDGVALGQTMPGPLAAQVAMWVGYLRAGALGALAVSVPFILPSFLVVIAVAAFYVNHRQLEVLQALFYGIAPAVMGIIAVAAVKLGGLTNRRDWRLWLISTVVLGITAVTGAEIALVFLGAGILMVLWDAPPAFLRRGGSAGVLGSALPFTMLMATATGSTQVALALFFLKAGAFIFGSGLAIVPFLREGVVTQHRWLTEREFLDAVAIGLITPGPVVITAAFIGYLVGGLLGAGISTVAIFCPIYLGVVIPGRWFIRHRGNPQIKAFVKGATAAAAGAIGGATIVLTAKAVIDVPTGIIAVVSLIVLVTWRPKEPFVVLAAGILGLMLYPIFVT